MCSNTMAALLEVTREVKRIPHRSDLDKVKEVLDLIGARTTVVTNGAYTYLVVGYYRDLEDLATQNHLTFFNDGRIVCD
jgi:hypothetical protein